MRVLEVTTPLSALYGIGPKFLKRLEHLGIRTVRDLLWHFPARYEDFSHVYAIADLEPGQQATVQGRVQEVSVRRSWRKQMTIIEATIEDETGSIRVVWFNQPYLKNILHVGKMLNIAGKVSVSENELYLSHPIYEIVPEHGAVARNEEDEETKHTARLVPVYPETKGLTSKGIRAITQPILKNLESLSEWIPEETLGAENLPEINEALHAIHFPKAPEDATRARRRFAFEDLFLLQLLNLSRKEELAREKAPAIPLDAEMAKQLLATLPFELTLSQKKSLWEIMQDLERPTPMNRLLQGDVGSGKTVVVAIAAFLAGIHGYQTAFMAPTEVLARQHFETLKKLLSRIEKNIPIALLVSSEAKTFYGESLETQTTKQTLHEHIARGDIAIVVGTHALIQKSVSFKRLGLVIVDEQHRFGVAQRAALVSKHRTHRALIPHFLSMSATPIPRTLMLTVFGDLDISIINELPSGRKRILTKIVPPEKRAAAYQFIRKEVARGRQIFVICPRIEPPQKNGEDAKENFLSPRQRAALEVRSVKEEYEKLSKTIFPDLSVAMLHGQMPARGGRLSGRKAGAFGGKSSKETVMKAFQKGEIDVLVSTSVVEVGVDVPNATVMMIEGSDRFGLAQLYQFRGRVGRGEHQSYCFLFTDSNAQSTAERLKALTEAKNGFELAEYDLKFRGPGEFLGTEQTGFPDIAMKALQDPELVKSSREAALEIMDKNPKLSGYPAVKEKMEEFRKKIHPE